MNKECRFKKIKDKFNKMLWVDPYINGILTDTKEYNMLLDVIGYNYKFSHYITHREKNVTIIENKKPTFSDLFFKKEITYIYIEYDKYIGDKNTITKKVTLDQAFELLDKVQDEMFCKKDVK